MHSTYGLVRTPVRRRRTRLVGPHTVCPVLPTELNVNSVCIFNHGCSFVAFGPSPTHSRLHFIARCRLPLLCLSSHFHLTLHPLPRCWSPVSASSLCLPLRSCLHGTTSVAACVSSLSVHGFALLFWVGLVRSARLARGSCDGNLGSHNQYASARQLRCGRTLP